MTNPTDPRVEAALEAAWNEPCLLGDPIACHSLEDAIPRDGQSQMDAMKDVVRQMVVAALKAADASAWQPIESAPHNRKVTLGWREPDGKWKQAFEMASYDWKCGDYASGVSRHNKATHWRPLPHPPEAKP